MANVTLSPFLLLVSMITANPTYHDDLIELTCTNTFGDCSIRSEQLK